MPSRLASRAACRFPIPLQHWQGEKEVVGRAKRVNKTTFAAATRFSMLAIGCCIRETSDWITTIISAKAAQSGGLQISRSTSVPSTFVLVQ